MKKVVLFAISFVIGISVFAQDGGQRRGNWGEYDLKQEKTFKTKVTKIEDRESPRGNMKIANVSLDGENYMIFLGTQDILDKEKFSLKEGDQIEVTGVLRETRMGNMITPRIISNNGKKLEIRDKDGKPKFMPQGGGNGNPKQN